jgi:lipopolysaccharide export system protein LptA
LIALRLGWSVPSDLAPFDLLGFASSSASSPPLNGPIPIDIQAEEQEGDLIHNRIQARGNVTATSEGRTIHANELSADLKTRDIDAEGQVSITDEERQMSGDHAHGNLQTGQIGIQGNVVYSTVILVPDRDKKRRELPLKAYARQITYDLKNRTGALSNLETDALGFHFKAASGRLYQSQKIQLVGAEFSACPLDEPQKYGYHMRARTVDFDPQKGGTVRHAAIYIGDHHITTLSQFHFRGGTGASQTRLPLPTFGRSSLSGYFLSFGFQPSVFSDWVADSYVGLTEKIGPKFSTNIHPLVDGVTPYVKASIKEEVTGKEPRRLLIDRLPEAGLQIDDASSSPLRRWFTGNANISYIRKHGPELSAGRASLTLTGNPVKIQDLGQWRLSLDSGFHQALYTTDDSYRDLHGGFALSRRWTARRSLRVALDRHFISGTTPFTFDETLVPVDFNTQLRWSFAKWGLKVNTTYDVQRHNLFDATFGVGYLFRCVEPRLVYRYRVKEIGFELNLVGLGDIDELPPEGSFPPAKTASNALADCPDCRDSLTVDGKRARK